MKTRKEYPKYCIGLSLILSVIFGSISQAESSVRFVVFEVPAKQVVAARVHLNDATKGAIPDAFEALKKIPDFQVVADFTQTAPWSSKNLPLTKGLGDISFAGEVVKTCQVQVLFTGSRNPGEWPRQTARPELILPMPRNGYREKKCWSGADIFTAGRWLEVGYWGDTTKATMVWQYTSVAPEDEASPESLIKQEFRAYLDMRWFKADESDIAKLKQAQPANREKALSWLEGRAELWKRGGIWLGIRQTNVWGDMEVKQELKNDQLWAEGAGWESTIDLKRTGDDFDLKMDAVTAWGHDKKVPHCMVAAKLSPGVWEFVPLEGVAAANVLACRLSPK